MAVCIMHGALCIMYSVGTVDRLHGYKVANKKALFVMCVDRVP